MSEPQPVALSGVSPGMEFGEVVYGPLTRSDIDAYAGASGDLNPVHRDEDYARAAGAPTVFAMGMLPAGYLAHAVSDWFGGPHRLRRFKVRFAARVWPGDEIICTGRVDGIAGSVATVSLEARRRGAGPDGYGVALEEIAIIGVAEVELPEE